MKKTMVEGTLMRFGRGTMANGVRFVAMLAKDKGRESLTVTRPRRKEAILEANRMAKRLGWTMEKPWERA